MKKISTLLGNVNSITNEKFLKALQVNTSLKNEMRDEEGDKEDGEGGGGVDQNPEPALQSVDPNRLNTAHLEQEHLVFKSQMDATVCSYCLLKSIFQRSGN